MIEVGSVPYREGYIFRILLGLYSRNYCLAHFGTMIFIYLFEFWFPLEFPDYEDIFGYSSACSCRLRKVVVIAGHCRATAGHLLLQAVIPMRSFGSWPRNGAKRLLQMGLSWVIGVPPVIIHFSGIFPNKNHPAIGDPPFMEPPKYLESSDLHLVPLCRSGTNKWQQKS